MYATLTDFKSKLGSNVTPPGRYEQLTDLVNQTTADDLVGMALLNRADATVNQKLARRYQVPIDAGEDVMLANWLKDIVLAIAAWSAWADHPRLKKEMPGPIQTRYDEVMKTLQSIAAGEEVPPSAGVLPVSQSMGPVAEAVGSERVFTDEALDGL